MRPTIGRHGTGALARWEDLASDQGGLIERWRRILVLTTIGSMAVIRFYRDLRYPFLFGFDGRLYVDASRVWLSGGDPWAATYAHGIRYAAPPPSLLATVPLTLLEPAAAGLVMVGVSAVLAYLAIRTLGLPAWWLLWAPILDGVLVGSLDIATMALLIVVGGRLSGFAPLLKIYAVLPMVGERRWRALVVSALLVAITIPILPWDKFLADLSLVNRALTDQTIESSAWIFPILVPIFAVGLASLGMRRAGYLAVPVLWPRTQLHYSALIVPVASTSLILTLGFGVGFIVPLAPLASVAVYVAVDLWRRRAAIGTDGRRLVGDGR